VPNRPAVTNVPIDATEGTPIDIIFLVERLESIIANGRRLPLTNNVVVDQAAALGLIDELRVAVPEEVRAAKRINSEGERIIEKAQEEAERIVAKAQEQAAFLIDERGLTQQAEAESRRIIGEAEDDAEDVRRGADEYAVNVLVGLEGDVVKTLQSIKKGIDLLDSRRADLRAGEEDGIGPDDAVDVEALDDVADDEDAPQPVRR
jgi:F0F1-type ATP synthase membrane subunit b/b'